MKTVADLLEDLFPGKTDFGPMSPLKCNPVFRLTPGMAPFAVKHQIKDYVMMADPSDKLNDIVLMWSAEAWVVMLLNERFFRVQLPSWQTFNDRIGHMKDASYNTFCYMTFLRVRQMTTGPMHILYRVDNGDIRSTGGYNHHIWFENEADAVATAIDFKMADT